MCFHLLKSADSNDTDGDTQIPTEKFMMEKISWTDGVKNAISRGVKEERNLLHMINQRKAN